MTKKAEIPFGASHTYIAHIKEYPSPCVCQTYFETSDKVHAEGLVVTLPLENGFSMFREPGTRGKGK